MVIDVYNNVVKEKAYSYYFINFSWDIDFQKTVGGKLF
jgi:hypothetical protein